MSGTVSTVKFGWTKTNSTSVFLMDSVPKVGFCLMAFTRAIGLREHETTIMWLPMWSLTDCVQEDLYLCVHDQCSRTVTNMKTKHHLMLKPYYILHLPYSYPTPTLPSDSKVTPDFEVNLWRSYGSRTPHVRRGLSPCGTIWGDVW